MNSCFRWGFRYKESGRGSWAGDLAGKRRGQTVTCGAAMNSGRVVAGDVFGSGIDDAENGS